MERHIALALKRIPLFHNTAIDTVDFERLGGLTNLVYRIGGNGDQFVLRIPGKGTEEYIDRKVEAHNTRVAAGADVSPEVLFFDEDDGLMLTRFLGDCVTMSAENFKERSGSPARAARALRKMHECKTPFSFRFELFAMIDEYLGTLGKLGATLPDGYHEVVKEADVIRRTLNRNSAPLAPCHCDPLAENFLDDGERMWVVDWEYSGMNDPIWDLGDVSVEAGFSEEQDEEMMVAYCEGTPSAAVFGRMIIYKAMCDLLWTLWGLIQHANENPAEDFWAYSVTRFQRCQHLMGDDAFGTHLAAIGPAE